MGGHGDEPLALLESAVGANEDAEPGTTTDDAVTGDEDEDDDPADDDEDDDDDSADDDEDDDDDSADDDEDDGADDTPRPAAKGSAAPSLMAPWRKDAALVFSRIDADDSGMLDLDEIKECLEEEGNSALEPEELEAMVSAMDDSGDDVIDEAEFLDWWKTNEEMRETLFGALLRKVKKDESLKPLRDRMYILFDELDEDEGGFLEQHELAWALTKAFTDLGAVGVQAACEAAMKEMDEDGDDQIDFDEFFGWAANNVELAAALEASVMKTGDQKKKEKEPEPEKMPGEPGFEPEPEPDPETEPDQALPDLVSKAAAPRKYPDDARLSATGLMQAFRRERGALYVAKPGEPPAPEPEPEDADVDDERIQDQAFNGEESKIGGKRRLALMEKYASKLAATIGDGLPNDDRRAVKAVVEALCRVVEWEGLGAPTDDTYIECRAKFASLDDDSSGELEEEEIRTLAEQLGNELSDFELDIAMKQMDADGSGAVDFGEFFEWWVANKDSEGGMFASIAAEIEKARKVEDLKDEAMEMFKLFDDGAILSLFPSLFVTLCDFVTFSITFVTLSITFFHHFLFADGSGSLDKNEVRKLAQSMGMNLNAKELDIAFASMDSGATSHASMDSDAVGDVDFDEFFAWYSQNAESDGGMFYR